MAAKPTRRTGRSSSSAAAGKRRPSAKASRKTSAKADTKTRKKPSSKRTPARPKQSSPDSSTESFPIVGIGASAGGFESLMTLLRALPPETGMAFVIVQHLDPKHTSRLSELLARVTDMPVKEISQRMMVRPNCVHVIPANYELSIRGRMLQLSRRPASERVHMAIDHFFESLAAEHKEHAVGVVLSGTGRDGTLGLAAIKEAGGITFAEAEQSARYFAMPGSAIAAGYVDAVFTADQLARELPKIGGHPRAHEASASKAESKGFPESADDLGKIFYLIRQHCGVDFSRYKHSTLQRRLARRMIVQQVDTLPQYISLLRKRPEEINNLFNDILINVTGFFRDPGTFEALRKKILPKIVKLRQDSGGEIRVWVPGCSTGEEVYSIAILLMEIMGKAASQLKVQIFGTDLSETILAKARLGIYPDSIAKDVSPERLRRFFKKVADGYQINRPVREICTFARQNICHDPPFSHLDLISCRNVLIYLGPTLQRKVMPIFHYALKAGGYLLLGTSETIGGQAELFSLVDKRNKIYSKKVHLGRSTTLDFNARGVTFPRAAEARTPPPVVALPERELSLELQRRVDQIVLASFCPPGVVMDKSMHVVQFRGRTGPFFEHQPGAASLNLLQMVRGSLVLDLRSAIHKAFKDNATVRKDGAFVKFNGHAATVTLHVIPFCIEPSDDRWYLVLFEQVGPAIPVEHRGTSRDKHGLDRDRHSSKELKHLRGELDSTRESLQGIIEEREATNEELKSANEEIQSANEELQSTNEELETAKEELQSANEELTTVNEELGARNVELAQVNNDLNNLLSSINIPIIIVDNALVVRRVTPLARNLFNLLPSDVGRQIGDIKPKLDIPDLDEVIREVIDTLGNREREVRDSKGHTYSLRVRPYRTTDNKIDGAVVTLMDIDELKRISRAASKARGAHDPFGNPPSEKTNRP